MKLKIVKDSNPIMRKRSLPVELPLSKQDKETLDAMLEHLKLSQDDEYANKHNIKAGVGLAAIQVGVLKRMFVIYYHDDEVIVILPIYQQHYSIPQEFGATVKILYLKEQRLLLMELKSDGKGGWEESIWPDGYGLILNQYIYMEPQ